MARDGTVGVPALALVLCSAADAKALVTVVGSDGSPQLGRIHLQREQKQTYRVTLGRRHTLPGETLVGRLDGCRHPHGEGCGAPLTLLISPARSLGLLERPPVAKSCEARALFDLRSSNICTSPRVSSFGRHCWSATPRLPPTPPSPCPISSLRFKGRFKGTGELKIKCKDVG